MSDELWLFVTLMVVLFAWLPALLDLPVSPYVYAVMVTLGQVEVILYRFMWQDCQGGAD